MKKLIVFTLFVSLCLWNAGASLAADWSDGADGYIYYTSGKVGIGTSSPIVPYKFSVISNLGGVEIGQSSYIEGASNVFEPNYPTLSVKRSSGSNGATIAIGNSDGQFYLNGTEFNLRVYSPFEEEVFRVSSAGDIDFKGNLYQNGVLINLDSSGTEESKWSDGTGGIYYNSGNVGIGTDMPEQKLSVNGIIHSSSGGFKFPDGTIQTTASSNFVNISDEQTITGFKTFATEVKLDAGITTNHSSGLRISSYGTNFGQIRTNADNDMVLRVPHGNLRTNGDLYLQNQDGSSWNDLYAGEIRVNDSIKIYDSDRLKGWIWGEGSGIVIKAGNTDEDDIRLWGNIYAQGNVGIKTENPQSELAVNGTITAKEVIVTQEGWPDYVFKDDHKLMPLDELEQSIKKNGHLPDIPSAEEVKKNGVSVGEMQASLLRKVEELTLYMIQLKKENEILKKQIATMQIN
ncbi:MAG: hypothetical protein GY795_25640 [Desulfobacterales bacterium]|nr:hypothetical protein [Desulfobacterales bacterium]